VKAPKLLLPYSYQQWDAKQDSSYVAGVIKFDRWTGIADIELDSRRFGLIRYHRLKDKIPTIIISKVPFDPDGCFESSKRGHWFEP